jgi:hypothetical protein
LTAAAREIDRHGEGEYRQQDRGGDLREGLPRGGNEKRQRYGGFGDWQGPRDGRHKRLRQEIVIIDHTGECRPRTELQNRGAREDERGQDDERQMQRKRRRRGEGLGHPRLTSPAHRG